MKSKIVDFVRPKGLNIWQAVRVSLPITLWYLAAIAFLLVLLPERAWYVKKEGIIVFGLFGLWRYAWQVLHLVRQHIFKNHFFPALREKANELKEKYPKRIYFMIPSFFELPAITRLVFYSVVRECLTVPCEVVAVISVGSNDEIKTIKTLVERECDAPQIRLVFMIQSSGKRVAMGHALRTIAREYNSFSAWHDDNANDLVIFMDGDTMLCEGVLQKVLPLFKVMPKLAVATTNNLAMTRNNNNLFQQWYDLKFAQRNHQFQSHSLSKRILTATGRFSVYRAGVILNEEFIRFVEADYLEHWIFGRFRFLMGDDKSTWFYLLKNGYEMLYVPDASIVAIESRSKDFFKTSISLMRRWYGNMLRNNTRALALGPKKMGFFIWWCILDQRLTTWTPLVGLVSAIMLAVFVSPFYFLFYMVWVCISRLAILWVYVSQGFRIRASHIALLLYSQWSGSLIKLLTMYNLKQQEWNKGEKKEKIEDDSDDHSFGVLQKSVRYLLITMNIAILFFVCGLFTNTLLLPHLPAFIGSGTVLAKTVDFQKQTDIIDARKFGVHDNAPADEGIRQAIAQADADRPALVQLPEGRLILNAPVVIDRSNVTLAGAGPGKTILEARFKAERGDAAILVRGSKGKRWGTLFTAARRGDHTVVVVPKKKRPDENPSARFVWIGAPNTRDFLDALGSKEWDREYPWVRQTIAAVDNIGQDTVHLELPLSLDFPTGADVFIPKLLSGVVLRDFSITQNVPEMQPQQATREYQNLAPDYAVDAIRLEWTDGCLVRNVSIRMAGRHAIAVENSYGAQLTGLSIDGAWNKGPGGNGYVRFARAYHCRLEDSTLKNIRHLAFQWSAANNTVQHCRIETDVNFHGGFSHDNVVKDSVIAPPPGHPWGQVTTMPMGGAHWAPMDGPGNIVEFGSPGGRSQQQSGSKPELPR